jgi:hypothetical protein
MNGSTLLQKKRGYWSATSTGLGVAEQLSEIERVSNLTDQVRRPKQARLGVGLLVVLILRNGEPGQLYCTADSIRIDEQLLRKTLAEENLRAPDMPSLEEGV